MPDDYYNINQLYFYIINYGEPSQLKLETELLINFFSKILKMFKIARLSQAIDIGRHRQTAQGPEVGLLNKSSCGCDQIYIGDSYESGHTVVLLKLDLDVQQTCPIHILLQKSIKTHMQFKYSKSVPTHIHILLPKSIPTHMYIIKFKEF